MERNRNRRNAFADGPRIGGLRRGPGFRCETVNLFRKPIQPLRLAPQAAMASAVGAGERALVDDGGMATREPNGAEKH